MAFRIKTFEEILTKMAGWVSTHTTKITDFNKGSTARVLLEAVAWVIKDIYADLFITFRTALKDFIYDAFEFGAQEALKAGGNVRFNADNPPVADIIIDIGTVVETSDSVGFVTTAEGVLPSGNTVTADIPVTAVVAGSTGNVIAGSIDRIVKSINGIDGVNNPLPTTGGLDQETDEGKQFRFQKFVKNLARSTPGGLEAGAETVSGVKQAQLVEDPNIRGYLYLYVDDGSRSASTALLNDVQFIIEGNDTEENKGYRGAGTIIEYLPVVAVPVNLVQTLYVKTGADTTSIIAEVEAAETEFINSYKMGVNLRLNAIRADAMQKFPELLDLVIASPASDIVVADGEGVKATSINSSLTEADE